MNPHESNPYRVDVLKWEGQGFRPMVESGDWVVAWMNWEKRFDETGIGDIERHMQTDEVFVLAKGRGALLIVTEDMVQLVDMEPGSVYNVTKGTWHSVIGLRDTTWLIVESKGTSSANTQHRRLTESEIQALKQQYPQWLRQTVQKDEQ